MVLYNEIDSYCTEWLGNLIAARQLPAGRVESRSIADLRPSDCAPTSHFFAGIGGWPLALRMAGWPDDVPVWSGSCPCQPFSVAGSGRGTSDERHLWPEWFRLIRECRPPVIFGEQVASPAGLGWLDAVFADLEGAGYACGALDLSAASVGAPHIRQRLYFVGVADAAGRGGSELLLRQGRPHEAETGVGRVGAAHIVAFPDVLARGQGGANGAGSTQRGRAGPLPRLAGHWSDAEWIACLDGRARCAQPGAHPLAHGLPRSVGSISAGRGGVGGVAGLPDAKRNRVGRLRGYGNAIVPPLAAVFIRAVADSIGVRLRADGNRV